MKRRILIALVALGVIVAVVGLTLLTPGTARARAQVAGECAHDGTIASLERVSITAHPWASSTIKA